MLLQMYCVLRSLICPLVLLAYMLPVLVCAQLPVEELLWLDTFNVSTSSPDVNFEHTLRQSGLLGKFTYTEPAMTRSGGNRDVSTLILKDNAASQLLLTPVNGPTFVTLSPNHNFIEKSRFVIEFDLDCGINDAGNTAGIDYAGIIFGASLRNTGVGSSDGMGVAFRNNATYTFHDRNQTIYQGNGGLTPFPVGKFRVRIVTEAKAFDGTPATVAMFVDGKPVPVTGGGIYTRPNGFTANYLTLTSFTTTNRAWVNVFDNLTVKSIPCIEISPGNLTMQVEEESGECLVTVPQHLIASQPLKLTINSPDPRVAVPVGSDALGNLTLHFAAGGANTQSFRVKGFQQGIVGLNFSSERDACLPDNLNVFVTSGTTIPDILLEDSFQTSVNTRDLNFERERQRGRFAPLSYAERSDTRAGASQDVRTEITSGSLKISPSTAHTWISPEANFAEGHGTVIEFKIHPGSNLPTNTSTEWAAVNFGASRYGDYLTSSDGVGILFRNNGHIQVFDQAILLWTSTTPLPVGNKNVRIVVDNPDFSGRFSPVISMFVNDVPVKIHPSGTTYTRTAPFRSNFITFQGIGTNMVHQLDDIKISSLRCIEPSPASVISRVGSPPTPVSIIAPATWNRETSRVFTITSNDPAIAVPEGAVDGALTIELPANQIEPITFNVVALAKGETFLDISNEEGFCTSSPVWVSVRGSFIENPSFEEIPLDSVNGSIPGWISQGTGASGINSSAGPYFGMSPSPDQLQIAYLAENAGISQTVRNLVPGQSYLLQFRYDAISASGNPASLNVQIGSTQSSIAEVIPQGELGSFYSANIPFTASASTLDLSFATPAFGSEKVMLIDAVTLIPGSVRDVAIQNASFEASGFPKEPGTITPDSLSGWEANGTYGVAASAPLLDNGVVPDQDHAIFLKGPSSISQSLSSLTPGETHFLKFFFNAKQGEQPQLQVSLGEKVMLDELVTPVGAGNAFHFRTLQFVPSEASEILTFSQTKTSDAVVLVDFVAISRQITEPVEIRIEIERVSASEVKLTWPDASQAWSLQVSPNLNGPWSSFSGNITSENGNRTALAPSAESAKFYRLRK